MQIAPRKARISFALHIRFSPSLRDLAAVAFWAIVSAADPPTVPRLATMSRNSAGSIASPEAVFWPHQAENIRRC
jgi:hypothetical protein